MPSFLHNLRIDFVFIVRVVSQAFLVMAKSNIASTAVLLLANLLLTLVLSSCAVGPDYQMPATTSADHWNTPLPAQVSVTKTDAQAMAAWWRQFNDATLSALVDAALQDNLDIHIAQARLREARAAQRQASAQWFPSLDASVSGRHVKSSGDADISGTNTLYQAGLDASWEPDIFGGVRRANEAASADEQGSEASLQDVQVSLAAEVALNYVSMRTLQEQLRIAQRNLQSQADSEQLARWRAQAGLTSSLDAEQARTVLEQTRAQIPSLETSLAATRNRLAVLLGLAPGALQAKLASAAKIPVPPTQIAIGIPADTVRQRPDVRVAERTLAAATARIGVAQAARFPSLSLSGSIGLEALSFGALGDGGTQTRSLAAGITAPLFEGGALAQQVEIRDAQQQQALAAYQSAVLVALEDVENALTNFSNLERRQVALANATDAARNASELARVQYDSGLIDFSQLLDAERTQLNVETSLAQADADRAAALIQLYKALGGGWSNTPEHSADTPNS